MGYASNEDEFYELVEEESSNKKILIEGDSWVSHPLVSNLASQIDRLGQNNFNILNLAVPGDTVLSILDRHGHQYKKLTKLLVEGEFAYDFDMIFLSAAGNDIVGPEIRYYVDEKRDNPGRYGRELLNDFFYKVVDQIRQDYERFLNLLQQSPLNQNTPLVTHAYSYLHARPVGTHILGYMANKGWIFVYLEDKGITDQDEKNDVAAGMLKAFYDELSKIDRPNFLIVDTLEVLCKNGKPDKDMFYDEIHPRSKGFKRVATKIRDDATAAGLWPE